MYLGAELDPNPTPGTAPRLGPHDSVFFTNLGRTPSGLDAFMDGRTRRIGVEGPESTTIVRIRDDHVPSTLEVQFARGESSMDIGVLSMTAKLGGDLAKDVSDFDIMSNRDSSEDFMTPRSHFVREISMGGDDDSYVISFRHAGVPFEVPPPTAPHNAVVVACLRGRAQVEAHHEGGEVCTRCDLHGPHIEAEAVGSAILGHFGGMLLHARTLDATLVIRSTLVPNPSAS